jgi:hypothetical protein
MILALDAPPPSIVVDKIVLFIGFYATALVIAWQVFRILRVRADVLRAHAESRNRLLGMVSSLEELLAFARTAEGRELLEPPRFPSDAPHGLHLIQAGVAVLGVALGIAVATRFDESTRALLVAFMGLGLIAGGYVGRWLRARWLRDTRA